MEETEAHLKASVSEKYHSNDGYNTIALSITWRDRRRDSTGGR